MPLSERARQRLEASYRNMKAYRCSCSGVLTTNPDFDEVCEDCGEKFVPVEKRKNKYIEECLWCDQEKDLDRPDMVPCEEYCVFQDHEE